VYDVNNVRIGSFVQFYSPYFNGLIVDSTEMGGWLLIGGGPSSYNYVDSQIFIFFGNADCTGAAYTRPNYVFSPPFILLMEYSDAPTSPRNFWRVMPGALATADSWYVRSPDGGCERNTDYREMARVEFVGTFSTTSVPGPLSIR
jgi:hypothetical protein